MDASRTGVVGASIGANMALVLGAAEPEIDTVGLLSPGLDYRGVATPAEVEAYGERPPLIAVSVGEGYAADSSSRLHDLARDDRSELFVYPGSAHGIRTGATTS